MTVVLSPELERLIQEKVKSGIYPSAEAMLSAAIATLLRDDVDFEPGELDELVKVGTDELDRGEEYDGAEVFDEIKRKSAAFARDESLEPKANDFHDRKKGSQSDLGFHRARFS